jgi:ribosomal protein L11 methyltransferase
LPYRIDLDCPPDDALDVLVELGALDIEATGGGVAAILPDGLAPNAVRRALGGAEVRVSEAVARDNASVWLVSPRVVRVGGILIAPPGVDAPADALRLIDSEAFGTGHHATTALCIEAMEEILGNERVESVLDVGTGSGILALAALKMGVAQAVGLDVDAAALEAAMENARLNELEDRLKLVRGGPGDVEGQWALVVANVLAAPLMEMAPALVRRVGRRGRLILSGIPWAIEAEVRQAYQRLGMRHSGSKTRDGWTAVVTQASW